MLKPITLKPAIYISALVCFFLIIIYLLSTKPLVTSDPAFTSHHGNLDYRTIDELLADVKKHQSLHQYQAVIDILERTDVDRLVFTELSNPVPRVILIDGFSPTAYGIEEPKIPFQKYGFVSFPETTDAVTDPGFSFWILWAKEFTHRYNSRLESEFKKKQLAE